MTDAEAPPVEEPDTPAEEVAKTFPELVERAQRIVELRTDLKNVQAVIDKEEAELLPLMQARELHGIALPDGAKVRRRWSSNRPAIDPVKLAAKLADATDFLRVETKVDSGALKEAYPELWREFGGRSKEGIVVALLRGAGK